MKDAARESEACRRLIEIPGVDPEHEEHDDLMVWSGGSFDPETIDTDAVQKRVAKLARRRTIGKAAFAKSRNRIN